MTRQLHGTTCRVWQASAYGRAEDLQLQSIDMPQPGGQQVLVAIEATSLNPLDLKLLSGAMKDFMPVSFPFVPGSDLCGTIISVGADARGFAVGDRIVAMVPAGAMATHALCDTRGPTVHVPHGPADHWASLPMAGMTALAVMDESGIRPGDRVAIVGATGGVGLMLCQLASFAGGYVVATATLDDIELVRSHGATETLDYSQHDTIDLLMASRPGGFDVIVDLVNQFDGLLATARAVRPDGRLVSTLVGPPPAAFGGSVDVRYVRLAPTAASLLSLVDAVEHQRLRTAVTARFDFERAPQAYLALRDGHARGKLVVHHD